MKNQGVYSNTGGHMEGSKDLDCLQSTTDSPTKAPTNMPTKLPTVSPTKSPTVSPTDRVPNSKRGLAMHTAQSCHSLDEHDSVTWWYSWGTKTGFSNGFCDDADAAATTARNVLGKEFVPMFWNEVPSQPFDSETEANLQSATYLLTFNEPERDDQANISESKAASLWPSVVSIAEQYNLQLIAPCGTIDHGHTWYNNWLSECINMYGKPCEFDYTCLHAYYQPEPCDGSGDDAWTCIGVEASNAMNKIEKWYTDFGKPTWVTEFACNPWGDKPCNAEVQAKVMSQFVPQLDASDAVYRYAWFSAYSSDFGEANTNEIVWEYSSGETCENKIWIAGVGDAGWQIQTLEECINIADQSEGCYSPLTVSMDDQSCYCATNTCASSIPSWPSMKTWKEVSSRNNGKLTPLGQLYQVV